MRRIERTLSIGVLVIVALGGCSDDPAGPEDNSEGEASFGIILRPQGSTAAMAVVHADLPPRLGARIPLEQVTAISVALGRVEARQVDGPWVPAGNVAATVNLLTLPADGLTLLDSSLPEGDYDKLRLLLTDEPTITLGRDVTVGRSVFEAGEHPLVIPSGEQNGLRLRADFTVGAAGEVLTILFDDAATLAHVSATGSGVLKISPELRVRDREGDDVGEGEGEDEDEGEERDEVEGLVTSVSENGFTMDDHLFVEVTEDTEIRGDLLTMDAVAEALDGGEEVEAEVEGTLSEDGTSILAHEVEFETADDDGDGDAEDSDEEFEVEGPVTRVDRGAQTFTVDDGGTSYAVAVTEDTEIDHHGDLLTFGAMADAFDAGAAIRAEAEGQLQDDGSLRAEKVKFETEDDGDDGG